MSWDPGVYDSTHRYVTDYGTGLVELLAPQPGEKILDVGCGTGHLTYKIAQSEAEVLGIDSSPAMVAQARQNYPRLKFELVDASNFVPSVPFDAVFSNAVLHWVQPPEPAIIAMRSALGPGGRLVVEFGGHGNVASITEAAGHNPWYYPRIGEYTALLEAYGFEVTSALLYPRPTKLEGESGLQEWLTMFFRPALDAETVKRMEEQLRPKLYRDGSWFIDYRRLRITATACT